MNPNVFINASTLEHCKCSLNNEFDASNTAGIIGSNDFGFLAAGTASTRCQV